MYGQLSPQFQSARQAHGSRQKDRSRIEPAVCHEGLPVAQVIEGLVGLLSVQRNLQPSGTWRERFD